MQKLLLIILALVFIVPAGYTESYFYKAGGFCQYGQIDKSSYSSCDPFIVKIDGYKYFMFEDNGAPYTYHNILGCKGQKEALFDPLRELDKDNDKVLTQQELKDGNIRFVKLDIGSWLAIDKKGKDYPIDDVAYIDLKSLRVGSCRIPLGSFDLYLYPNNKKQKQIIGKTYSIHPHKAKRLLKN